MKKKLALFLALVMVITSLPMTVFASINRITHGTNARAGIIFYERGLQAGNGDGILDPVHNAVTGWIEGTNLVIELRSRIYAGEQFHLTLENAEWFFRHAAPAASVAGSWMFNLPELPGVVPAPSTFQWHQPLGGQQWVGRPVLHERSVNVTLPSVMNANLLDSASNPVVAPVSVLSWTVGATLGTTTATHDPTSLPGFGTPAAHSFVSWDQSAVDFVTTGEGIWYQQVGPSFDTTTATNWTPHLAILVDRAFGNWLQNADVTIGPGTVGANAVATDLLTRRDLNPTSGERVVTSAGPFGLAHTRNLTFLDEAVRLDLITTPDQYVAAVRTVPALPALAPGPAPFAAVHNVVNFNAVGKDIIGGGGVGPASNLGQLLPAAPVFSAGHSIYESDMLVTTGGTHPTIRAYRTRPASTAGTVYVGAMVEGTLGTSPVAAVTSVGRDTIFGRLVGRPTTTNPFSLTFPGAAEANTGTGTTFIVGHSPAHLGTLPGTGFVRWGYDVNPDPLVPNVGGGVIRYYRVTSLTNPQHQRSRSILQGNIHNLATDPGSELPYFLEVNTNTAQTRATITMLASGGQNDRITIPLVIRTNADGDYRVRIESALAAVTPSSLLIGRTFEGRTIATAEAMNNHIGDRRFRLRIAEQVPMSIHDTQPWEFELIAPSGWHWSLPGTILTGANVDPIDFRARRHDVIGNPTSGLFFHTEGGLRWANGSIGAITNSSDITVGYGRNEHNRHMLDVLQVHVPAGTFAVNRPQTGSLFITGLRLIAYDVNNINFGQELIVELRNSSGAKLAGTVPLVPQVRSVLTNQTFDLTVTPSLQAAIDFAQSLNSANYTRVSWAALQHALSVALEVAANEIPISVAATNARDNLLAAIENLAHVSHIPTPPYVPTPPAVEDLAELNQVITDAQIREAQPQGSATRAQWTSFRNTLTQAISVRDNANSTQAQVNAMTDTLRAILNNLPG